MSQKESKKKKTPTFNNCLVDSLISEKVWLVGDLWILDLTTLFKRIVAGLKVLGFKGE